MRVVLDTNVLIAGLRSAGGASFQVLQRLGGDAFIPCVSVPLILECEAVAKRQARELGLSFSDIDDVLDYICSIAEPHSIFYLWRPQREDISINQLIATALAEKMSALMTSEYLAARADRGSRKKFDRVRKKVKQAGHAPVRGDEV